MKDSLSIKFLYGTVLGRTLLKPFVKPSFSKKGAAFFKSGLSAWLVPIFVKKNNIDLSLYEVPVTGYKSFNDFFTRKMKPEYQSVSKASLVSPCDGLLTFSQISRDSSFYIKHTRYSVAELLKDVELSHEFIGGTAYVFRLTPAHYHRYSFCTDGTIAKKKRINGILHSVQPICHEKTKVFVQNSREYVIIDTEKFGKVVQMEVGALLVGKISNHNIIEGAFAHKGKEKGYFEYGGSSIVVLTQRSLELPKELQSRVPDGEEIPVKVGERIY